MYFDTLNRAGVAHECDRWTDGQTDRTDFRVYFVTANYRQCH